MRSGGVEEGGADLRLPERLIGVVVLHEGLFLQVVSIIGRSM